MKLTVDKKLHCNYLPIWKFKTFNKHSNNGDKHNTDRNTTTLNKTTIQHPECGLQKGRDGHQQNAQWVTIEIYLYRVSVHARDRTDSRDSPPSSYRPWWGWRSVGAHVTAIQKTRVAKIPGSQHGHRIARRQCLVHCDQVSPKSLTSLLHQVKLASLQGNSAAAPLSAE